MSFRIYPVLLLTLLLAPACVTPPPAPEEAKKENLLDLVENQKIERIREIFGLNTDVNSVNNKGQTALHIAALKDLDEIAAVLLVRGANINAQDNDGNTPLHLALQEKSARVMTILVKNGADLFAKNNLARRPLTNALADGLEQIKALVTVENINAQDENGNAPLHYAADQGNPAVVEFLLGKKARPDTRNFLGETALDAALKLPDDLNHAKIAKLLLQNGSPSPKDSAFSYLPQALSGGPGLRFEQGNTALHFAAARGQKGLVELLLLDGAPVDAQDVPGNTPFHKAIENGSLAIAQLLLKYKADPNARDFNNNSALHLALTSKKPAETVSWLLGAGADPNLKNNFGNTPLHLVVSLGLGDDLLSALLAKGADVNARNKNGNSPLFEAVKNQKPATISLLLKNGASLFAVNNQDQSPLSLALTTGLEATGWLLNESNITQRDDSGNTPLHIAVKLGDYPEILQFMLSKGAKIGDRNKSGNTPLHLAIERRATEISQFLIRSGADIYALNNNGLTPLGLLFRQDLEFVKGFITPELIQLADSAQNTPIFHAVFANSVQITNLLLQKGASIQAKNLSGATPLHEAVRLGLAPMTSFLLKSGANPAEKDNQGNLPLHYVVFGRSTDTGDLLLAALGAGNAPAQLATRNRDGLTPLHEAVRRGEIKMADYFLQKKSSLQTQDNSGRTPLFDAVLLESLDMLKLLVANGAKVLVRDASGNTPLHVAASSRNRFLINYLIDNGADLFAENRLGETPISMALQSGLENARLFLNKANVNTQSNQGNSPLHMAVLSAKDATVLQFVLSLDPDINLRNKNGRTPLDLALDSKNQAFAELLLKAGAISSN